eukprot:TRINITY_DN3906_c0_g1_i1.p2 TRINITY_DN3906_c0_g1~~TRINITY_DN3906_c0_g1_i1.p2  ORF type:complete len:108 (+),score=26.70 TRINITY_DN3906_c0_g1_i1:830-1153(+)
MVIKKEKWTKSQQWYLLPMAIAPGILAYLKLVTPIQAGFIVMLAYIVSRRHANALQAQFEEKQREEEARKQIEEEAYAKLPAKKRKNIDLGKQKKQREALEQVEKDS